LKTCWRPEIKLLEHSKNTVGFPGISTNAIGDHVLAGGPVSAGGGPGKEGRKKGFSGFEERPLWATSQTMPQQMQDNIARPHTQHQQKQIQQAPSWPGRKESLPKNHPFTALR
jgi:hypothetical protein